MAGRPRSTQLPTLPRVAIPEPPDHFTDVEKAVWKRLAHEVELAGTYDAACYTAFRSLVRRVAAEEALDLSPGAIDTPASRIIALADTARSYFGLQPAARKKVAGAPIGAEEDPDFAFTDEGRQRFHERQKQALRVVKTTEKPAVAKKPWEAT